ncbi:Selenocysteine-specific translation elongation factor [Candidatus Syntrophocurvum alkaliphilum]|uniref:Selenocysteine-specific elongation factor n=1 Tax=Candidatus Syntrophocurvum alkaliphilum TaxID=2293317 RepID=A0A6I6DLA7_9FIRM|nr:selenocysteine-specific translation elongation factor [Candidatus Syntrophocurvum alkaliphilum]QGU00630.1 Selenocysteine-specific translation elongation factor [Candidatus Syntrophocurvum alkaliphilum]
MKRIIIGTAGHIDHGKTTLVKTLTGIETDRLKEEKQRGISIELGFAPFDLPDGQKAAIVDVPGHERFIKHMLAGAFGIDMVLFTIAADEGIMPQTREHMDIIELLGVDKGIVVLTKTDLVDEEWLMLMEEEVKEYIEKTILKGAPIISVSAVNKEGVSELLNEIVQISKLIEERPVFGHARLPVDRVFTVSGFGTVVTGTLWSGKIKVGETLELMPINKQVKIRTLQVHNDKVDIAYAGQRVAVNLQGVDIADIKRGYLLASSGYLSPSYRVDTKLRLLSSSQRSLKNWNRIRFHLGTDEALGRIVLLDRDEISPGEEGYAQIVMEKPIVCFKNDPFVIRYYSPVTTIGGGTIIDSNPPKQKRFREDVLKELSLKEEGSLYDIVLQELESKKHTILTVNELAKSTGSSEKEIEIELEQLIDDEKVVQIGQDSGQFIAVSILEDINKEITNMVEGYHEKFPLRQGYPREDIRSRLFSGINNKIFTKILNYFEENNRIIVKNNFIMLKNFIPQPNEKEQKIINQIYKRMNDNLFTPPSIEKVREILNIKEQDFNEMLNYLIDQGQLLKIAEGMYFTKEAIEKGKEILKNHFEKENELTLAQARDLLNTSRKYALPLIEYYDRIRFTRRVGDVRVKI